MGLIMKKRFLLSFYLLCLGQLTACTTSSNELMFSDEDYGYIDTTDHSLGNCGVNGISCADTALVNYTKTEADFKSHTERTQRDHLYTKAGTGNNLTSTIRPSIENDIIKSASNNETYEATSIEPKKTPSTPTNEEYIPVVDDGEFSKTGALNIDTTTDTALDEEKPISDNPIKVADNPIKVADNTLVEDNAVAIADNIDISKKIITKTITEEDGTIYELVCQDEECSKIEQVKQIVQGDKGMFEIICEKNCEEFMLANTDDDVITSEFTEESFDLALEPEAGEDDTEIEFNIVGTDKDAETQVLAELNVEETKVTDESILTWEANEGDNVRELITKWSNLAGWKLLWNTNRNYTLSAGVVFKGKFADVSSALIRAFARARPAPVATYYKGNRVIVVETMENENAY